MRTIQKFRITIHYRDPRPLPFFTVPKLYCKGMILQALKIYGGSNVKKYELEVVDPIRKSSTKGKIPKGGTRFEQ